MKKIIQLLTALSLTVQIAAPAVFAAGGDSVTISGTGKRVRQSLTAKVTPDDGDFSYQWYSADSEDGDYKTIIGATEEKYKLSTLDAGKYITVKATNNDDGETVEADTRKKLESLGPVSKTSFKESEINSAKNTPSDNVFYVDGQGFIMLGQFHDTKSTFYVMSESFYGTAKFDENGVAAFKPKTEGNIGYFLNNGFLTDGSGGKKLPEKITDHIDYNHVWWTEKGLEDGDCAEDYSFTAGISLLSASEADLYYGVYGWQPAGEKGGWWLRTQKGSSAKVEDNIFVMGGENDTNRGNADEVLCTEEKNIRPAFYLDKDFFKEVKLDVSTTGKNVGKALKAIYTADELGDLYTSEELIGLGVAEKEFEAKLNIGTDGTLTAKLSNLLDKELSNVKYQWKYKTADSDTYTDMYKENGETYVFSTEDYGRTIAVDITPVLADGTAKGPYTSTSTYTVSRFGSQSRTSIDKARRIAAKTTPEENLFTVGGQQFVLVNEYSDDASAFLVMSEKSFGKMMYDEDNTQKFDVTDRNNIGYFLNNGFLTDGIDDKKLPEGIVNHIDFDHIWWTEAGTAAGNCPSDYSFKAGISLISRSEYSKYLGVFGWNASDEVTDKWWGRTARDSGRSTDGDILVTSQEENGEQGNMWNVPASNEFSVRPVFYLDADFFKDVKISDAGANVVSAITDRYTASELVSGGAGYTISELIAMGIVTAPRIKEISIDGSAAVNAALKGSYTYSSHSAEGASVYGFEVSADGVSYSTAATGVSEYTVKETDSGKYVRFFCTPTDVDGVSGDKATSRSVKISTAQDITVSGAVAQGSLSSSVRPSFTLRNSSDAEKKAVCIIAAYDKNGYIVALETKEYTIAAGEEETENSFSLSLSGVGAKYARVFVVDSLEKMNSLIGYEVVIK